MNTRKYLIPCILLVAGTALFGAISPIGRGTAEVGENSPGDSVDGVPRVVLDRELAALVNDSLNIIVDRDGALHPFLEKLAELRQGGSGVVNILHIGDSHVQAGFWDDRMREHLTRDFGNAGRGLVLPHRLTGTNEPRDYYIRTGVGYEGYRTTSNQRGEKLAFTGTGVEFTGGAPNMEIWHRGGFDAVTVHHHPAAPFLAPPDSLLLDMQCAMGDTEYSTTYYLNRTVDTLRMEALFAPADYVPLYYGFTLHGGPTGVMYHAVGANSAAFEHFERQTTIPDGGAAAVLPDLIIVSLGTNNCFGRNYRSAALRLVVERFFGAVAANYPGLPVLVTTPRESCNLSRGRRVPNPNIEDAAAVIRESAEAAGFAYWDLYNAAGGRGIAETWYNLKLSGRDRIHLTESGYQLVGDMLYDAIAKYYNGYISVPDEVRARVNSLRPGTAPVRDPYDSFRRYSRLMAAGDLYRISRDRI